MGASDFNSSSFGSLRIGPFPGEEPTIQEIIEYLDSNQPLVHALYGAELRGDVHPSLISLSKVADMTGIAEVTGVEAKTPASQKHNLTVRQQVADNACRAESFAAAKIERSNSLAQGIDLSMRMNAPLRLSRLQSKHKIAGKDDTYNGVEMWKDLAKMRTTAGLHEEYVDHDREVERLRDEPLPDGCAIADFTHKVNLLAREHMPYMDRPFASEESKARFIVRLMPACNAAEGRQVLRRLETTSTLNMEHAIKECTVIVKESQSMSVRHAAAVARQVPLQAAVGAQVGNPQNTPASAAFRRERDAGGGGKGKDPQGKTGKPPRGGARLPDDQWCWEGTCHFDHAKEALCWRAPWFKGDDSLPNIKPGHAWNRVRSDPERIEKLNRDKAENATRLGKPCFRLKVMPKRAVTSSAVTTKTTPANLAQSSPDDDSVDGLDAFRMCPASCASIHLTSNESVVLDDLDQFSDSEGSLEDQCNQCDFDADSGDDPNIATEKDVQDYFAEQEKVVTTDEDVRPYVPEQPDLAVDSCGEWTATPALVGATTSIPIPAPPPPPPSSVGAACDDDELAFALQPTSATFTPAYDQLAIIVSVCLLVPLLAFAFASCGIPAATGAYLAGGGNSTKIIAAAHAPAVCSVFAPLAATSVHEIWSAIATIFVFCLYVQTVATARPIDTLFYLYEAGLPVIGATRTLIARIPRALSAIALAFRFACFTFVLGLVICALVPRAGAEVTDNAAGAIDWCLQTSCNVGISTPDTHFVAVQYLQRRTNITFGGLTMNALSHSEVVQLAESLESPLITVPIETIDGTVSHVRKADRLTIGDSGAGVNGWCSTRYAVPGTIETNNTYRISTANGIVTPPVKFEVDFPILMEDNSVKKVRLKNNVLLPGSEHNLVSLGLLASELRISTLIAPPGEGSRIFFPDGSHAPMHNIGVLIFPDAAARKQPPLPRHAPAGVNITEFQGPVVHGQEGRTPSDFHTIHERWNHAPHDTLRHLPNVLADAPQSWIKRFPANPKCGCDACLRGSADSVPSFAHTPEATRPGHLVSYDIWYSPIGHVHGGQHYVIGFHDHFARLDMFYLLSHKSQALSAIKEYHSFARSHGVSITRMNTDNAGELSGRVVKEWARDNGIRITTCCPNVPRGNHAIEQRWRHYANVTRRTMAAAAPPGQEAFPVTYWWYFFRAAMSTQWCMPLVNFDLPSETPWFRYTGRKPSGRHLRKPGVLCYYKVMHPQHKLSMRARRAVLLGRAPDQPGYLVQDLSDRTLHVTPHVRFCERVNPGVGRTPLPGEPTADNLWLPGDDCASSDPPADPSPPTPAIVPPVAPRSDPFPPLADDDDGDDDAAGPISQRAHPRAGRIPPGGYRTPGALANLLLALGVPATGQYYMYLGSNVPRPGDVASHLRDISDIPLLSIDTKVGGYQHDLSDSIVGDAVVTAASDVRCLGVLTSLPCKLWSSVRSELGEGVNARPVRDCDFPLGYRDVSGNIPAPVLAANKVVDVAAAAMAGVFAHGGFFIAETPTGRGSNVPKQFAIPGKEKHINQFEHPSMRQLRSSTGAELVRFDQCRTRDDPALCPRKTTDLLVSPNAYAPVFEHFGSLTCNHSQVTHPSMKGVDEQGALRSSQWEEYSSHMNQLLAACLQAATHPTPPSPSGASPGGASPLSDWQAFFAGTLDWVESATPVRAEQPRTDPGSTSMLSSVMTCVSDALAFRPQLYQTGVDDQCFLAPRAVDYDNPTYNQATDPANPDCPLWLDAMQNELYNMEKHVAEPVLEDTLPSWNPAKSCASEVVNLLWVLKKKYLNLAFDKCKARICYDGAMQKKKHANRTGSVLETFAPTARHTTQKLACAHAVSRGAPRTHLSSQAYIMKLARELPKPLGEYSAVHTPCTPDLIRLYEDALDRRANIDPTLAKSYPVKVGKLIYAMPASRVDCCFTIGVLARCLTFPTPEMDAAADRCLVYLAQHADAGPTYDPSASHRPLEAYCDSDWCVSHSTSGWCILYCGAVVAYGSKRQHSIALSSTEAEIMSASLCAAEIVYHRGLLRELGADVSKPTVLRIDNRGALELAKDARSCQRSRHIERRYLKIREWVASGEITVEYVPTADNPSDLLTKALDAPTFRRHSDTLFGVTRESVLVPVPPSPLPSPKPLQQRTFDVEAAYLKGEFEGNTAIYGRPPRGARHHVRGVPVVWRLCVPLYGEADAGRLWNRTFVRFIIGPLNGGGAGWTQSQYDPCFFFKVLDDGSRMHLVLYVDDGYVIDNGSALADAELQRFHDRFTITIKKAKFFLGNNVTVGEAPTNIV